MGGVLPDWMIEERIALPDGDPLRLVISPFSPPTKEQGKVSWGLSSMGYDIRLGRNYVIFNDLFGLEIDPITIGATMGERVEKGQFIKRDDVDRCVIPPNSFVLAESLEYIAMPRDVIGIIQGKSTWARCGISLTTTPIEPAWRGIIVIEIANHSRLPAILHSGHGIGQLVFFQGVAEPRMSYADKPHAQYQDQVGITHARA